MANALPLLAGRRLIWPGNSVQAKRCQQSPQCLLIVMPCFTTAGLANNQLGGNFTLGINFSFSLRIN